MTRPFRIRRGDIVTLSLVVIILAVAAIVLGVLLFNAMRADEQKLAPRHGVQPLAVISGPGTGEYPEFGKPMGVAFGLEGRLYVTDAEHDRVCVFDRNGRFLFEFGGTGVAKPLPGVASSWRPGLLNYPVGIAVDDRGLVYIADFRNDQIQVFTAEGEYVRHFPDNLKRVGRGSSGQDGKGIAVTDVAVSGNQVFATDAYQVFSFELDGTYRRQFGRPGIQAGGLDHPNGVALGDGVVYVSDTNHARVTAYTFDGNLVWSLGTPPRSLQPTQSSEFSLPRGLDVLDDGSLLIADAFQFALVEVSPDGKVAGRYGDQGEMPGEFRFLNDVDSLGDLIAIADKENDRVQLVRLKRDR